MRHIVDGVFDELAEGWAEFLRGPNPRRRAWEMLRVAVAGVAAARGGPDTRESGGRVDALHRVLPSAQADAVLVHYRLGLTLTSAADLMGTEPSAVALDLVLAERALSSAAIRELERPSGE
ncbi:hypothetical protein [Streptomyces sp. SID3343]|uniref:hypothetical protein n=1 Tax=Streptomyces sp. SID3343 TaxID=2690260 RepID=UPI001370EA01|nr:hypothetical protein [Streptomyces sp. SID3343]MYW06067.1 hypothetical protein [Streptomyces sp. SID3343]